MKTTTQPPPALDIAACGRDYLPTNEAAQILNRRPQTLRKWHCLGCGPLRAININGRLAWSVKDIASLLNGNSKGVR